MDGHRHMLLRQLADVLEDFAGQFGLERRGRFIKEQHLGIERHGARDAHALLLPAAELARIRMGARFETHLREQRHGALLGLGTGASQHDRLRLGDVAQDGEVREQVEILKYKPDAQADAPLNARRGIDAAPHQLIAANQDVARRDGLQIGHAPQERRFAAAGGSDDRQHLTLVDAEGNAVQDFRIAEPLDETTSTTAFMTK